MSSFHDRFERQKRHFATGVTRYARRIEQLDRMGRLIGENEAALQRALGQAFKTATQEQVFETLACLGDVAFLATEGD
jgi:aldehyde dehydrogenase (NAD+)